MDSSVVFQQLGTLNELLHETNELCNNHSHHDIIEEQNEKAWRRSEEGARWNEMLGKLKNIKADIQNRKRGETETTTDTSTLLEVMQQNHQGRLDAIAIMFEGHNARANSQREELLAAIHAKRKASR